MKKLLQTLKEKWAEYLLEILVITIGILGAFALNNWNSEVQSRNEAYSALIPLRNEIIQNVENEITVSRNARWQDSLVAKILSDTLELRDYEKNSALTTVLSLYSHTNFKRTKYESFIANKYDQYVAFQELAEKLKLHYDPANYFSKRDYTIKQLEKIKQEHNDRALQGFPDYYKIEQDTNAAKAYAAFVTDDPYFKNRASLYRENNLWMMGLGNVSIMQGIDLIEIIDDLLQEPEKSTLRTRFLVELSDEEIEAVLGQYESEDDGTRLLIEKSPNENALKLTYKDTIFWGTYFPKSPTLFISGVDAVSPGWEFYFDLEKNKAFMTIGTNVDYKLLKIE